MIILGRNDSFKIPFPCPSKPFYTFLKALYHLKSQSRVTNLILQSTAKLEKILQNNQCEQNTAFYSWQTSSVHYL